MISDTWHSAAKCLLWETWGSMVAGTNLASLRRNLLLLSSWWEQIVMTKTADTSKSYVNSYYCMWCHNWAHNNVHNYYYYYYYYYYYLNLFSPVSHQVAVFRKSRSRQEIKAISPNPLHMLCAVFISVTFCSSVADGWPGSNWNFWTLPFFIIPNTPVITGTILSALSSFCWPHLQIFVLA